VAHRADVDAFIQEQHDKTEAEREALRQKDIKRRAASVVAWAPSEGELTLANDNFIRAIEEKAAAGSEVAGAALAALRSPQPPVWAAFIETGIHAASERDKQIALDRKAAADRRLASEIKARADNSLVHPALSAAAATALAGTPGDVDLFLRAGQFDALTQSLRTTSPNRKGWWVQSGPGVAAVNHPDPGSAASVPVADATWKVVDGLAGEGCHSLESTGHPGHYLRPVGFRVQLQPSDGSTEFKNAATWCAKKGLGGPGVSLEAKAQPGRYLRHLGAELWIADNSGANAHDRACGYQDNTTWQVDGPDPKATKRPDPVRAECVAECPQAVSTYVVRNDGQLRQYQHADPLNGGFTWVDGAGKEIGQGWLGARTVAGPDGVVYVAVDNGELRRFRWNGTGWDVTDGAQYKVIDRGWERYATAAYRNRITVDTRGDIYTVEPDGRLHWRSYQPATGSWEHRTLDGDWSGYDLIVAAGTGVIYARTPAGALFRHHYDAARNQWAQQAKPAGYGWQMFSSMFSAGADILYGAHGGNGGELLWYRYLPATETWADTGSGTGRVVGTGWYGEYNLTAAPDACRLN
ncbi:tachylectin-related carbohydrate-binding protein, partial [Actinoplanes sp. NPDC051470]|uniref:tachylectin-related carbohydrate-binding protein n=1 Tax=Actinoplanes sp. NPDC051470 TaxID=3157224 RepID=UPI00342010F7